MVLLIVFLILLSAFVVSIIAMAVASVDTPVEIAVIITGFLLLLFGLLFGGHSNITRRTYIYPYYYSYSQPYSYS